MKLGRKLPLAFAAIVLMVMLAAFVGIYSLNQAIAVYDTQLAGNVDNERTVSDIESEFKTQVQEWKNVLLRGSNPEMFDKHWQAFAKMESHVNEETTTLAARLPEGESKHLVSQFAHSHKQLGLAYRKGLEAFKAANFD
jgi:methyl-accepting chemotaxis protein-1 (serine sensor receptor)